MKAIFGKKVGMTQLFGQDGTLVAATAIQVNPNLVVDVKTKAKHGYDAIVIGYEDIRPKLVNKPKKGQFDKNNLPLKRHLAELRNIVGYQVGDYLKLEDQFKVGDIVDVQAKSKGHGFTGAIKLWNFSTGPRSHGAGWPHRYQGSLETGRGGASAQRVWKGKKMAGRYGNETVSVIGLQVLQVLNEQNLILLKGAVPGKRNGLVRIRTTNRAKKTATNPFQIFVRNPVVSQDQKIDNTEK